MPWDPAQWCTHCSPGVKRSMTTDLANLVWQQRGNNGYEATLPMAHINVSTTAPLHAFAVLLKCTSTTAICTRKAFVAWQPSEWNQAEWPVYADERRRAHVKQETGLKIK